MNGKTAKLVRSRAAFLLARRVYVPTRQLKRWATEGSHKERHAIRKAWAREFVSR